MKCFHRVYDEVADHLMVKVTPDGLAYVEVGDHKVSLDSDLLPTLTTGWHFVHGNYQQLKDAELACVENFGARLRKPASPGDQGCVLLTWDHWAEFRAPKGRAQVRSGFCSLTEIRPGDTLTEYRTLRVRGRGANYLRLNTKTVLNPVSTIRFDSVDVDGVAAAFANRTPVNFSLDLEVVSARGKPVVSITRDMLDREALHKIDWDTVTCREFKQVGRISSRHVTPEFHKQLLSEFGSPKFGAYHTLVPIERWQAPTA
jgi:hypothetical protein